MSEIQNQFIDIVRAACKGRTYRSVALGAGITGRAISYWLDGDRVPRDIEVMEMVLASLGYRLVIQKVKK